MTGALSATPLRSEREESKGLANGGNEPELVGEELVEGAAREGEQTYSQLARAVDFPEFVSGLIEGVFKSIVDATSEQMEAYRALLEAVVESVDELALDNVTEDEAREHMRNLHPSIFRIETAGEQLRLRLRSDIDDNALAPIRERLGLDSLDLHGEEGERQVVESARLQIARKKQQQLATMVMMGINRIVVTDVSINFKVEFKMSVEDSAS